MPPDVDIYTCSWRWRLDVMSCYSNWIGYNYTNQQHKTLQLLARIGQSRDTARKENIAFLLSSCHACCIYRFSPGCDQCQARCCRLKPTSRSCTSYPTDFRAWFPIHCSNRPGKYFWFQLGNFLLFYRLWLGYHYTFIVLYWDQARGRTPSSNLFILFTSFPTSEIRSH